MLLPGIEVTDAQGVRILAAFKAKYGTTTNAETAIAYKREVLSRVAQVVMSYESEKMAAEQAVTREAAMRDIAALLPNPADVT